MLGRNYPGTDWYARAYKLMQENQDKLNPVAAAAAQ